MEKSVGKYTASFGIALAITSLFSSILVVVKELSEDTVMAAMKRATGHHWVTHVILDTLLFVVLGFLLTKVQISAARLTRLVIASIVIGAVIIVGFYLFVG